MKKRLSLLAAGLLLAGCSAGPQVATTGSGAMLVLTPEVVSGGLKVQAMPPAEPYTVENINRLVVTLYTVTEGVETPVVENGAPVTRQVARAHLSEPVIFSRLKANTTYRAKTEAWGYDYHYAALDADPEKLLSTNDANSFTDIVVTDDDRPTAGKLKVRLKARLFSGQTDLSVTIGPGGLVPGATESLTFEELP